MKIRTAIGAVVSVAWCAMAVALVWLKADSLGSLKLNEWGDFFAGMMAPLALFWLVLGYLQQGDELQTNTDALRAQEEQLRQQVAKTNALAASAARQANAAEQLANATRDEASRRAAREEADAQPHFVANGGRGSDPQAVIQLYNAGARAKDLSVDGPPGLQLQFVDGERLNPSGTAEIVIIGRQVFPYDFTIHYKDASGVPRAKAFTMYGPFRFDEHAT